MERISIGPFESRRLTEFQFHYRAAAFRTSSETSYETYYCHSQGRSSPCGPGTTNGYLISARTPSTASVVKFHTTTQMEDFGMLLQTEYPYSKHPQKKKKKKKTTSPTCSPLTLAIGHVRIARRKKLFASQSLQTRPG
jgi:hypothetical protein